MTHKTTFVALIVIAIIAIVGLFTPQGRKVAEKVVSPVTQLGAVSTLDGVDMPFISIGGKRAYSYSQAMIATSSTICAIQNPFRATSTITVLSAQSTSNGIAVANNLYVSTSTTQYGSSTPALVHAFAMGTGQWFLSFRGNSATTTGGTGGTNSADLLPGMYPNGSSRYILGPSEWVTFRIATSTAGTFASYNTGTCTGLFERL